MTLLLPLLRTFYHCVSLIPFTKWGVIGSVLGVMPLIMVGQHAADHLTAAYTTEAITLDGKLDEGIWQRADQAGAFWQFFPTDSVQAVHQTYLQIVYDDNTLYVGIHADAPHGNYVVSTLRRDFRGSRNDNVSIMFDTFSDGANAFLFGVTPYGVRREALISNGGAGVEGFNPTWDIKWQAESQHADHHYSIEMAIPLSSLKFPEGATAWRFRAYRFNLQTNERSTSVRVPQNQFLSNLAFAGTLHFERPLGQSRRLMAVIPYVNGLVQQDLEKAQIDPRLKVGGDAKFGIGDGLNLDVTVNPDFSNVEVDNIFTNLTRFEIQLPERRQFFIDNSDLFASFGSIFRDASPFFSRRIGLARDTADNLIENQILAGARLSGKLDDDWRLGFLNIQTAADIPNEIASHNNMMLALQRKVLARSTVSLFAINRETFQDYDFLDPVDRYNRVAGAEFNLASADNVWSGKAYLHKSFQPDDKQGNLSAQAVLRYNTRFFNIVSECTYIDEEFRADLGFVPRRDIFKQGNAIARTFYPTRGIVNKHTPRLLSIVFWRPNLDLKRTDHEWRYSHEVEFKDQSRLDLRYTHNFIYLTDTFDPTRTEDAIPLPADQGYRFSQVRAAYNSNPARVVRFSSNVNVGQFFNGQTFSAGGEVSVRFQPWALLGLNLVYDQITLPEPYASAGFWLATTRLDVTVNRSLFWSTLVQYSNQRDNLGINSRLQWRFAPLSDLYLVYNDNYYVDRFAPRFRSINLKVSYWLSV